MTVFKRMQFGLILGTTSAAILAAGALADDAAQVFDAPWIGYDTAVYPEGLWPHSATVGDFNGDGFPDLAASAWGGTAYLSVLINNGKGGYFPAEQYPLDLEAMDLVSGDFDNDGDIDIVVAETGRFFEGLFVSYWRNDGEGGFARHGLYATGDDGPSGITAADFDDDGFLDVAVAHDEYIESDNSFAVLRNTGGTGFATGQVYEISAGTHDIDSGDMNGDGRPDIAVAHRSNRWTYARNDGDGFVEVAAIPGIQAGSIPTQPTVHIGDVDNDGNNDVIFSNRDTGGVGDGAIGLWRNDGEGGFPNAEELSLITPLDNNTGGGTHATIADVTHDGWPDILVSNGYWFLLEGDGEGGFLPARLFHAGDARDADPSMDIEVPDVDLDGDLDVVIVANGSLEACVYLNPGQGQFVQPTPIPMADPIYAPAFPRDIEVADVDNDGDLDLVSGYRSDFSDRHALTVRRNNGDGTFGPIEEYLEPVYPADLVVRDMDGDGNLDIVYVNANGRFHLRKNDGAGNFDTRLGRHAFSSHADNMQIDAIDVDHDGDLDVTANTGFSLRVSPNLGDDTYGAPYDAADFESGLASNYMFGDFNEDGLIDLFSDAGAQGYPAISFGTGNGFFGPPNTVATGRDVQAMDAGDLDGDGNLDLVSFYNLDEKGLGVRRGRGAGNFFLVQKFPGAYYWGDHTSTLDLADFDGDGILDAVTTSFGAQDFSFWKGRGDGTFDADVRVGVGWAAHDIEPGDFDGDGVLDAAVICQVDNGRWWYPGVIIIKGQGEPSEGIPADLADLQVATGVLLEGGLPELESSDDASVHTRSGFGQTFIDLHNVDLRIMAQTDVANPTALDITVESRIDEPAGNSGIRLRNWTTGEFDQVGAHAVGETDQIVTIDGIDAADYVNETGQIEISIKQTVFVPIFAFTFESFFDQVEVVIR